MAWPRFGLDLSAMPGDEVQKRVAEVAKALYQRTDELAVLLARAITLFVVVAADVALLVPRRCPRLRARCAASTCIPGGWAGAYNDVHCSGSPVTVDKTPRGAFNPPI